MKELLTSEDFTLIERLGWAPRSGKAAQAFQDAFDMIGGTYRLAKWADQNPDKFYSIYSKLVPSTVEVNEKKDITVTINWAGPDRLSYRQARIANENARISAQDAVYALPQPSEQVGKPEHPPPRGEDSGPGQ